MAVLAGVVALAFGVTYKINVNFQPTFFGTCLIMSAMSLSITLTSFLDINGAFGDWSACKLYKSNDLFALNQFMENYHTLDLDGDIWDSGPLNKLLGSSEVKSIADDSIFVSLFEKLLYFSLANEKELQEVAKRYLEFYLENIEVLKERLKYENYALFFFRLILYISIRDNNKAIEIWEEYRGELSENDSNKYHIIQVESMLYKLNNNEYLSDIRKIKISSSDHICSYL